MLVAHSAALGPQDVLAHGEHALHGSTRGDGGVVFDEQLPHGLVGEGVLVKNFFEGFSPRKRLKRSFSFLRGGAVTIQPPRRGLCHLPHCCCCSQSRAQTSPPTWTAGWWPFSLLKNSNL
ncbi:hypothetical protein Hamer_G013072 [Homarus americanus]|uniref:Uncharacterized protein n=1 Tax=Homarus americanus TaxID=6706 RepID=A0A8J5K6J7_HOMAM|nr:hypothetical protein Hamer_G013072 [Homarus americanus]